MRNSSPKPSSRFSSSASTASYVLSRDVMPVPPVVMITCTSAVASCARSCSRTSVAIVLHDRAAAIIVAGGGQQLGDGAAAGVGRLGARVADVTMKQRTDGARAALCSASGSHARRL